MSIMLLRYENIKLNDSGRKTGPKYYSATAIYNNGTTQNAYLSEVNLKEYELRQRLNELKASDEVLTILENLLELKYEEGKDDGYSIGSEQ